MRRYGLALLTSLALVVPAALAVPAVLAVAQPVGASVRGAAPTVAVATPAVDFDGDGNPDMVTGAPGEDIGSVVDAGAVTVRLSAVGWQQFTQNSAAASGRAERNDHFGSALAAGDFNDDGFTDLAVGAATEDVGSVVDAGAVNVLYGTSHGLTGAGGQVITQNSPGVPSNAERGDLFGFALTAADFDNDGFADLAIGARREDGAAVDEGAVDVLYGTSAGLTGAGSDLFTQNNAGTGNTAEPGDLFGSALVAGDFDSDGFADLAVGVPHEDVFAVADAGALNVLQGSSAGLTGAGGQLFTEDSQGVAGSAEPGDQFGSAFTVIDYRRDGFVDLVVGVPQEDVYAATDAGSAYVLPGSDAGLTGTGSELLTQDSPGYADKAESGDLFGFSLAAVDFFDVGDDLAVGAPGEDLGSAVNAGIVHIGGTAWDTSSTVGIKSGSGDRFGDSLADLPYRPATLCIGVPGYRGGAGSVVFLQGILDDGDQLPPSGHIEDQSTPTVPGAVEPGDFFGDALVGS